MRFGTRGGGAGFEGRFEDLRLIRTTGATRTVVTVDLKKVIQGTAPDPVLQADDVFSDQLMRFAIKLADWGTSNDVTSILLYHF